MTKTSHMLDNVVNCTHISETMQMRMENTPKITIQIHTKVLKEVDSVHRVILNSTHHAVCCSDRILVESVFSN